jgi:hypothetical protein
MNDWEKRVEEDKIKYNNFIKEAWKIAILPTGSEEETFDAFKKKIGDIFDLGFEEGQVYVGTIRSAIFVKDKMLLPGDEGYPDGDVMPYNTTYEVSTTEDSSITFYQGKK